MVLEDLRGCTTVCASDDDEAVATGTIGNTGAGFSKASGVVAGFRVCCIPRSRDVRCGSKFGSTDLADDGGNAEDAL